MYTVSTFLISLLNRMNTIIKLSIILFVQSTFVLSILSEKRQYLDNESTASGISKFVGVPYVSDKIQAFDNPNRASTNLGPIPGFVVLVLFGLLFALYVFLQRSVYIGRSNARKISWHLGDQLPYNNEDLLHLVMDAIELLQKVYG